MTSCDEILARLSDALDGEPLDPAVEREVAAHLESCPECARAARELSSVHRLILEERVEGLEGTAAAPRRAPRRPHRRIPRPGASWAPLLLAAAALFAVALVAAVAASRPRPAREGEVRRRAPEPARHAALETQAREETDREERKSAAARARLERERLENELAAREEEERRLAEAQKVAQDESKRQELKAREAELARTAAEFREKLKAAQDEERRTAQAVAAAPGTLAAVAIAERADGARLADGAPLRANQEILSGQGIDVGPGGAAIVVYPDGTRLELEADTEIRAIKAAGGKKLHVAKGAVRALVARQPKDQPMVLSAALGEAKVVGTTLRLAVHADPRIGVRLEVTEGKVELKHLLSGKRVEVAAGHYAVAAQGSDLLARPMPRTAAQLVLDSRGAVTIKFGPAGQALPAGVLGDAGEEFDPDRGYGWQGAVAPLPVISNIGTNPLSRQPVARAGGQGLRGPLVFAGWRNHPVTWSMAVPNGRYWITVCTGDPTDGALSHVNVEGIQLIDAAVTAPGQYVEPTDVPVVVRDGTITMIVGGQRTDKTSAQGCADTHLQYVVVRREAPRK